MVVCKRFPRKSVCTSPIRLKNLSGDVEVTGTVRYCLTIRTKSGNSYWCCFHHIRGLDFHVVLKLGFPFERGRVEIHGCCTKEHTLSGKVVCLCECEDRGSSPSLTVFVNIQILSSIIHRLSSINSSFITKDPSC